MSSLFALLFGTRSSVRYTTPSNVNAARPLALVIHAKRVLLGGTYDSTPRGIGSSADRQDVADAANTALFGTYGR